MSGWLRAPQAGTAANRPSQGERAGKIGSDDQTMDDIEHLMMQRLTTFQ